MAKRGSTPSSSVSRQGRGRNAAAEYDGRSTGRDAAALYNQSLAYLHGDGVPKDYARSFELNRKAAALGDRDAILAMGWYFLGGVGVERDEEQGRRWYRESARHGEPRAMFSLGSNFYEAGEFDDARTWLQRAADLGHLRALFWLGKLYWRGAAVPENKKLAMKLFQQAAAGKVPEARRFLSLRSRLAKRAGAPARADPR
jgi:uncharacterized protein